ncbi:hypothetical protein GCM10011495_28810 [Hymenobacter frigidus]|uniref:Uncharacterized protein n=1 Tax=Hymenobacter frigidus TaxID=1524095 RepID=A0ABQ2A8J8_9BACT|nr:hypothetical protein [Hymenobacter frigidus]GGH88170.1 hypothetical protein GCM10011495_28810 [Hymenobacter frigidus]
MKTSKIFLAAFFVLGLSSTAFAQTTPGGTPTMPNGTTTTPNGTMSNPNGSMTTPSGTMPNPNGTMTSPNGTMTTPRSTEGTTYDRDRQDRGNMKSKSNMPKGRGKMKNRPMN